MPGKRSCDALKHNGTIGVQQSFHLHDNLEQVALALDSHPMVDYPDDIINNPDLNVSEIVNRTWTHMSGSSVWLPEHNVFLLVTRVLFYTNGCRANPVISFLRGQLYSPEWEHLENYTLRWKGEDFMFPTIFSVASDYETGGGFYGPEDPRVVLEEGKEGAEPVIVFNMIGQASDWRRAMYIYRPFSKHTKILTISDRNREETEKNWSPFFLASESTQPSEFIHFVYSFEPLQILKCHLRCGDCEFVFKQEVPSNSLTHYKKDDGSLRGGSNFVPVPIPRSSPHQQMGMYAAFHRTTIFTDCGGKFYRPEFVVMINIGSQFHLAFTSQPVSFGSTMIELTPEDDPCKKGAILLPMSIAQWNTTDRQDVMTMTFTVDDQTVQAARIHGLLSFVHGLPHSQALSRHDGSVDATQDELTNILASWAGDEVRACAVEAALNLTITTKESWEASHPPEEAEVDASNELLHRAKQQQVQMTDSTPPPPPAERPVDPFDDMGAVLEPQPQR